MLAATEVILGLEQMNENNVFYKIIDLLEIFLMKLSKIIVLVSLFATSINAEEISVSGGVIFYSNSKTVEHSRNVDEQMLQSAAGEIVQLDVSENVVLRGDNEKASFTPLKANTSELTEISLRAQKVIGILLPEVYQSVSTLHLRFYKEDGKSLKLCEVLMLDNLLDETHKANLRNLLLEQQVDFDERDNYIVAKCVDDQQANN